jgi:profilin
MCAWCALQIKPDEIKEVVNAYKDKGDESGVKQVQSSGLHVSGERYVVLKADERSLYGKRVSGSLSKLRKP